MTRSLKRFVTSTAVGLALLVVVRVPVQAQTLNCNLIRAKPKSKLNLPFGRTYLPCLLPDTSVLGGVPACSNPLPFPGDWVFDSRRTAASLQLSGRPDGDTTVKFKVGGLYDQDLVSPASGIGQLALRLVVTLDDSLSGYATTMHFEVTAAVPVAEGKGVVKTTLGQMLAAAGLGSLGGCWIGTVVEATFRDPNGMPTGGTSPLFSERTATSYGSRG